MLRVVLDPGVVIAGLISPQGSPAQLLRRWVAGEFQIICSPALIEEFVAVAGRGEFRRYFTLGQALAVAELLEATAELVEDRDSEASPPPDDGDAYLVHLVVSAKAFAVVTGDRALAQHAAAGFTAMSPAALLELLAQLP